MKGWQRGLLWSTVAIGGIAAILRIFFIDFYRVEEGDDPRMWANAPNIEPGDLLLIWKHATPHTGDLVRCPDPAQPTRWMIGRVSAIGGDRIELTEGSLHINGFRARTKACDTPKRVVKDPSGGDLKLDCHNEEHGASQHDVYSSSNVAFQETTVEPGKLFLLSDNRVGPWSYDSRNYEVGQLQASQCNQRVVIRMWSKLGWKDSERRITWLD